MVIAERRLTLDEFLALPEEKPALEYEEGVVSQKVSPRGRHSVLQREVSERFNRFTVPDKIAYAFPELRVTLRGRSYVPDVSVFAWARIPRTANGEVADDFIEAPDIAVEIVSPGQRVNALIRRCTWFVENGAAAALLVDADDRSVIVFRPGALPLTRSGSDAIELDDLLPGFRLATDELFASLSL